MICTNFDKVCSTIGISFGNWGRRHHWGAQNYRWGNFAVEKKYAANFFSFRIF